MKKIKLIFLIFIIACSQSLTISAQKRIKSAEQNKITNLPLDAFEFRNIGPAFLSGRIADIALNPQNDNVWYVAVGSAGVWKTENSGTTWSPLFDDESSYSIGCIALDPQNPATVWVGTGENVGGRHVAYGDGIYRSKDEGNHWENLGLRESEHISKIVIHPNNSDVIWVAAQGPLWSKGGQRGVFKTDNGGITWRQVLGNSEWTGATDLLIDPRNPQVLYAATWDRHRTVAAFMGGGPGSGIHKSIDGGNTWKKLYHGLPNDQDSNGDGQVDDDDLPISNMGKIGLAISPQNPDVLYAAIEMERLTGGVYRSENRGESWKKMSNAISGATGPHYYQELYASPHEFDRLYLMNVRVLTSDDGGKTFVQLKERNKHSDNHVIVFKKDDPDYLMIGTDAGIYESFDLAETWRYIKNLPLTQFYKVAVNNTEPFYHIFGGTQDNGSAGGPSATDERQGISNRHRYKTLGSDGHQSATDPVFNDIIYAETQQGGLHRVDLSSGEQILIQPQAQEGDPHERFNWDAPILVSPHDPARLYFASYRVWKSENRGDDWIPISGDLTRNEERLSLPIMGRQQSWDNSWDIKAMSTYNTITSLSESPIKEGLIYAGTDDGFIQVSENGGDSWTQIPVTRMGLPPRSFVNDIKADIHDVNTVYAVLDNHKEGDFNPYLFKSVDRGQTWSSMNSNLPKRTLLWRIVQDHVNKDLLFLATDFGIYTSTNAGKYWHKLPGTPNMGFRDLVIQKRENDLVAASFGRGFYVLDDYSPLREMNSTMLNQKAKLFTPRTAKWFIPKSSLGNTGSDFYIAKNPLFGAVFTYYLKDDYLTKKELRQKREEIANEKMIDIPFPGYLSLDEEKRDQAAQIWISISDEEGNVVRHLKEKARRGSHRIAWDLHHSSTNAIDPKVTSSRESVGPMVTPGTYSAVLSLEEDGMVIPLGEPVSFEVKPIRKGVLQGVDYATINSYRSEVAQFELSFLAFKDELMNVENIVLGLKKALKNTPVKVKKFVSQLYEMESDINLLHDKFYGSPARKEVGEKYPPTVELRLRIAKRGLSTSYGPTGLHRSSFNMAKNMLKDLLLSLAEIKNNVMSLSEEMKSAGAPFIKGASNIK